MATVELENLSKTFTLSKGWGRNRTYKDLGVCESHKSKEKWDGFVNLFHYYNSLFKVTVIG